MRTLAFLSVFCFWTSLITSQNVVFRGSLIDVQTKKPVVYANLSFLNSNKGISSDEQGNFRMNLPSEFLKSKVHISCLNYKDTVVEAQQLMKKAFKMRPKSILLDEVILTKQTQKFVTIGKVKKEVFGVHTTGLRMLAKYFARDRRVSCCNYIETVTIHFSDRKRHRRKSKFRIRIFNRDEKTGLPKDDMLNVNLPVEIKDGQKEATIDLSSYGLEMPENGIFLAFEKLFIPFNQYGKNDSKLENEFYYAPIIGYTKYPKIDRDERFYFYVKGKWQVSPLSKSKQMKKFAPAISLTLTN